MLLVSTLASVLFSPVALLSLPSHYRLCPVFIFVFTSLLSSSQLCFRLHLPHFPVVLLSSHHGIPFRSPRRTCTRRQRKSSPVGLCLQRVNNFPSANELKLTSTVNLATRAVHLKSQDHLAADETLATTTLDRALAQALPLRRKTPA